MHGAQFILFLTIVGGGERYVYTTWIGEVGLEHWGRSGLVLVMVRRDLGPFS